MNHGSLLKQSVCDAWGWLGVAGQTQVKGQRQGGGGSKHGVHGGLPADAMLNSESCVGACWVRCGPGRGSRGGNGGGPIA